MMDSAMQLWPFYAPASLRLAMFWIFLCAWTSVFFCATRPFLCSPGAVYQHVQSDHIHTCSPGQERSKFVHLQYSRDELLSVRPACLTPDLAARLRSLDIGFGWPRRRTRRGGKGRFHVSGLACLEDALGEGEKQSENNQWCVTPPSLIMLVHRKRLIKNFVSSAVVETYSI